MKPPSVSADDGSIALGGDNNGVLINAPNSTFNFQSPIAVERSLSTHLGAIITTISEQKLSEYGSDYKREVTAEVIDKLQFNYIKLEDHLFKKYMQYSHILEKAYKGVEQTNNDARVLVRLSAGSIYSRVLTAACTQNNIPIQQRVEYSRNNSHHFIETVKDQLIQDVQNSQASKIDPSWIDLAVSLLVADAVVECDVLEKAPNVTAA